MLHYLSRRLSPQSLTQRPRALFAMMALMAMIITALSACSPTGPSSSGTPPASTPQLNNLVRGYLAANVSLQTTFDSGGNSATPLTKVKAVHLPGVKLFLQNTVLNITSKEATTDLSGRFTLYAPQPGLYQLCWQSDIYGSDCLDELFTAGRAPLFLSTVKIGLANKKGLVAFTGKVTTADGSSPRTFDPMLNINAFATVALEDSNGRRSQQVYVNNMGEYLIPNIPTNQKQRLVVSQENG
ncbi:MAG: hypothetical protein ACI8WB_004730 [Phenylobacterium sp.]|jgi:hypothetical protein